MGTADLSYGGTAEWLRNIGFDYVEGNEASACDGAPRFVFDAAPDEYLYRRALGYLAEQPGSRAMFLVLETASSHSPFLNPVNGVATEAAAFGYADSALGAFFDQLEAQRYLPP